MEVAYAREDYKRIVGEIANFEAKGMFEGISPELVEKFKALSAKAKAK